MATGALPSNTCVALWRGREHEWARCADWLIERERERRRGENSSRLKPSTSGFVISDGRKHLRGDAPRDRRQHVFPKHLKVQHVYVSDSGEQHRTVKAADEDWSRFSVCSDLNQSPEAAFLSASSGQQSCRGRKGVQQNGSYSVMNKLRRLQQSEGRRVTLGKSSPYSYFHSQKIHLWSQFIFLSELSDKNKNHNICIIGFKAKHDI